MDREKNGPTDEITQRGALDLKRYHPDLTINSTYFVLVQINMR